MSELRDPPETNDFEWVNAWASGTTPPVEEPKSKPAPMPKSVPVAEPIPQQAIVPASVADTPNGETTAPAAELIAPRPPVTAPSSFADRVARVTRKRAPDADHFVHPATRRFFAALRAPATASPADTAPTPVVPAARIAPADAPQATVAPASAEVRKTTSSTASAAAPPPVMAESAETSIAPDATQLERDIADIESARDALVEPAPFTIADPRKPRGRFATALRHAESVPILVGSVVGATLLIVFGAAASLISLR